MNSAPPKRLQFVRRPMPSNFQPSSFRRDWLPYPADFYAGQRIRLLGQDAWRGALCPFHDDATPSMRVHLASGAYRCLACGAHGGDVVAFHMRRYGVGFIDAAKALGAWWPL